MSVGSVALSHCSRTRSAEPPSVLLYSGVGTSAKDVRAIQDLLSQMRVSVETVDAPALDRMSVATLRRSQLLIIPGGNFLEMGAGLTPRALHAVHEAVQDGLNYFGVCAGAFLAGQARYPTIALSPGVRFSFYVAAQSGVRKAAVPVVTPDGESREHYWEDGPQLSGWGAMVAKYPDGTPAIVEGRSGNGWVVLTGIHAEAPDSWRRGMRFTTSASDDNAYARVLIDAALHGTSLPHFQ